MTQRASQSFWKVLTLIMVAAFMVVACSVSAPMGQSASNMERDEGMAPAAPMEAPAQDRGLWSGSGDSMGEYEANVNTASAATTDRIVIKNASLTVVVDDPSKSMGNISKLADEMGGFVVSAQVDQRYLDSGITVPHASITIRVPAERLNEALDRIKQESDQDPVSEGISSQDVTSEYTDLQSRLHNLESAEAKLTEIMDSAVKTEDVMSVYNQLVQVREQIEMIKGQIKYYEQSAALSAVSVELVANEAVQPLKIGSWQPVGVAKDAVQALINALKFIANLAIWVVLFLAPVLLVLYLIFFLPLRLLWRAVRRRRAAKKAMIVPPPAPATPEA